MSSKLVTVFGGSGFVGRHVVREFAKRGFRVCAAVRTPHLAHFLKPMGDVGQIQILPADILHEASIARALEGADIAVNLVGVLHQRGRYSFRNVHVEGAGAVAKLAAEEGVNRLIHLSAIGADAHSDAIYARTKAEGEQAVHGAFPDATIMRPSIIFGPKDQFFNRFAAMAGLAPALPAIGFGKTRFQPVYVDDVADAICAAATDDHAAGRIYELGGPAVYTFTELMTLMLSVIERKRFLAPIPFSVAMMMGAVGQAVARVTPWAPVITEDQVRLLKYDNVVGTSGESGIGELKDLGIAPQTVEAALPTYLERFRKYGQFETSHVA